MQAQRLDDHLLLIVEDDGPGIELVEGQLPEFSGVGIANTRERLAQLYGEAQTCDFLKATPQGLRIEIYIPYEVGS